MKEYEAKDIAKRMEGGFTIPHPDREEGKTLYCVAVSAEPFDTESEVGWQIRMVAYVLFTQGGVE